MQLFFFLSKKNFLGVISIKEKQISKFYSSMSFHKCTGIYNPHPNQDRTFVSPENILYVPF